MLCDEPVSALDLPNRQTLIERLRAVQISEGIPVLYVTHSPAEAVTVGTRLFLLERGRVLAEGPPLDVLASIRGPSFNHLEDLRNTLPARVESQLPGQTATLLRLENGPTLIVPYLEAEPGMLVLVLVRAEDILLARGPISGLSAQNIIPGKVERVVAHGPEAEALIRTGDMTWIVSLVAPAVEQLDLSPGQYVHMIIKARSCHVVPGSPPRTIAETSQPDPDFLLDLPEAIATIKPELENQITGTQTMLGNKQPQSDVQRPSPSSSSQTHLFI